MTTTANTHEVMNNTVNTYETMNARYVILENDIAYDWDDYYVWGAVLYDISMNCIVTTKYGHGTDMTMDAPTIELDEAIKIGLVTPEQIITCMINELPVATDRVMEIIAEHASAELPTAIPVKVVRGRKFKGNGYLVYTVDEPVRYGLGAYHNEWHHYPVIFDPETCTENIVKSFGYLEYDQEFLNAHRERILKALTMDISTVESIAHLWAYNMSYSACDTENYRNGYKRLGLKGAVNIEKPNLVKFGMQAITARKKYNEELRLAKLKEEKMPGIIEWVKNNTDKTTDKEIMALAEHIFNKYNK